MNWKTLAATSALAATLGAGVLAGSLLSPSASANVPASQVGQVAQAAQAQASPTAAPDTQKPAPPADGQQMPGMHGGRDGFGGFGGFGGPMGGKGGPGGGRGEGHGPGFDGDFGGRFGGYSAEGATRAISGTTSVLTIVKGDLAYATGKMDTATMETWVTNADTLLKAAQTAHSAGEYGKAAETAQAASALAESAELMMRQELGADKLPSYTQRQGGRPDRGMPGVGPSGTFTVTQAQASRVLANLYRNITSEQALVSGSAAGDAGTYLAAAKDQYSKAYAAYQAGNYSEATGAAQVGQSLLRVVEQLLSASTAPNGPDVPVQVPAPFV